MYYLTSAKETATPSLCAFCAHRLGQAQTSSHVQRRFLQSSRPVSSPPAEGAARRNDDDLRTTARESAGVVRGTVQSAAWGRPRLGGIPPRAGGTIPTRPAPAGSVGSDKYLDPHEQAARDRLRPAAPTGGLGGSIPPSRATASSASFDETMFLDPHEQAARDRLLEVQEEMVAAARTKYSSGRRSEYVPQVVPGPRTRFGMLDAAKEQLAKRKGLSASTQRDGQYNNRNTSSGPVRGSRHVFGDNITANPRSNISDDKWNAGQLRRQGESKPSDTPKSGYSQFVKNRAEREERSKNVGYSPLSTRSFKPTAASDYPRQPVAADRTGHMQGLGDRMAERTSRHQIPERPAQPSSNGEYGGYGRDESRVSETTKYLRFTGANRIPERPSRFGDDDRVSERPSLIRKTKFQTREPDHSRRTTPQNTHQQMYDNLIGEHTSRHTESKPREIFAASKRFTFQVDQQPSYKPRTAQEEEEEKATQLRKDQEAEEQEEEKRMLQRMKDKDMVKEEEQRQLLQRIKEREREEEEEEDEERGPRKKKEKKRRGGAENVSYDNNQPKGKDRDKAKRRQQFVSDDAADYEAEDAAAKIEAKRLRKLERAAERAAAKAAPTPIFLPEYISVSNLAVALKVRYEVFVEKLEDLGFENTSHDYVLNAEDSGLIAQEYQYEAIIERGESEDLKARDPAPDPSILPPRPPVVTIMGHVDHGKTTLLDWLRKSSVAASEHGGITQHIGAFSVPMPSGKIITFLDTPGHAAFLSMRQRGANVTDIVVLVVAADDSVKPQTIEAINHAKAANVPIIVAINKVDKEEANIEKTKQDLARHGVDIEDFGGDTQVVCVSGKTGQGMEELEEAAVTLSEILDMRAETDGPAEGWVLEASIKSMGKVATVLVRRGTMRPGDFIVAGKTWARIRVLRNEAGVEIEEAGPGTPVQIDGWREQPLAGDEVLQAPDEGKAKSVVEFRLEKEERDRLAEDMEAINESRKEEQEKREMAKAEALAAEEAKAAHLDAPEKVQAVKHTGPKEVFFIVKGDVSGSVEAVVDSMAALGNKEVQPHILRSGVGQIAEFDVEHAAAAKGFIVNFNTLIEPNIARLAADAKVKIMDHNIIYRLVDDVKEELSKLLPPLITQRVIGEAEIAQVFSITVKGRQQKSVAGCKVRNNIINKTAKVRVLRDGEKIFDGMLYPTINFLVVSI